MPDETNGATQRQGGCYCGAVRYALAAEPVGTMVCHCTSCRRLSAAPMVAWLTLRAADFSIVRGEPAEFRSTPPVRRWFCARCGTHVAYLHEAEPGFVDVSTCSLDDPGAFPPTHHSWLSDGVAWARPPHDAVTFPGSRYGSD